MAADLYMKESGLGARVKTFLLGCLGLSLTEIVLVIYLTSSEVLLYIVLLEMMYVTVAFFYLFPISTKAIKIDVR